MQKKKYLDTPECRLGIQYLNEAKDYTLVVSNIKIPTLILHGEKDEDVPLRFSRRLFKVLAGEKKIAIAKEADHNFESHQALNKLINHSLRWFKKTL